MTTTTTLVLKDRAIQPYERLQLALADLADHELQTPCQHEDAYHLWTSESPEDRTAAAHQCYSCLVLHACGTYAATQNETYGVWAGVDRASTRVIRRGVVRRGS